MKGFACTVACILLVGCDGEPPRAAPASDPQLEAARVLLRYEKSRIDGVLPPASWPEAADVRRVGSSAFVVDIDTSRLPGGYPEQLVVEVSARGGRTGQGKR